MDEDWILAPIAATQQRCEHQWFFHKRVPDRADVTYDLAADHKRWSELPAEEFFWIDLKSFVDCAESKSWLQGFELLVEKRPWFQW